jgi:formyltetrahydrofolate deformylase
MSRHIILVDCPDAVGLVHTITGVLGERRLNIETNQEFVDAASGHFFFRAEVTAADGNLPAGELRAALAAVLPAAASVRVTRESRRPIVVCATREPHCLGELLLLDAIGELPGRIVGVVSNHDLLRGLVERFGVPFAHVPHEGIGRAEHEAALAAAIDAHAAEFVVLARYMRILSPGFVARYAGRMINIHHSFLPAFQGAQPYHRAWERGVKLIGATAHYVTEELDAGPIIEQATVHVSHRDEVEDLIRKGRDTERLALARALRLHLRRQVMVYRGRTAVFD